MSGWPLPQDQISFLSSRRRDVTINNGEPALSFGSIPSFSSRSSPRQDRAGLGWWTPQLGAQTVPPFWSHAGEAGCRPLASRQAQARLSEAAKVPGYLGIFWRVPRGEGQGCGGRYLTYAGRQCRTRASGKGRAGSGRGRHAGYRTVQYWHRTSDLTSGSGSIRLNLRPLIHTLTCPHARF